jgi:hypothetical protein
VNPAQAKAHYYDKPDSGHPARNSSLQAELDARHGTWTVVKQPDEHVWKLLKKTSKKRIKLVCCHVSLIDFDRYVISLCFPVSQ